MKRIAGIAFAVTGWLAAAWLFVDTYRAWSLGYAEGLADADAQRAGA